MRRPVEAERKRAKWWGLGRSPSTQAMSVVEVLIVAMIAGVLLVPLLQLSTASLCDHQEVMERSIVQGIALDIMERLKRYKLCWPLPGTPARPPDVFPGPPISDMFGPVEVVAEGATLFDRVYLDQMAEIGLNPHAKILREEVSGKVGVFRLTVKLSWISKRGPAREVSYSRICFAP